MEFIGSKNINTARIDAEGNVLIGDGNTIINLREAAEYKELALKLENLGSQFVRCQGKIEKYPEDEDFKSELLNISDEQNKVKQEIQELRTAVLKLAEDFLRIPVNTERLRLAQQYFQDGEFQKARAVLDAERMTTELEVLKQEQENLNLRSQENQMHLEDKANEFLILARLTAVDFSLNDRFEKAKTYYDLSISALRNDNNLSSYGSFLSVHGQFIEAISIYQEALKFCRGLAEVDALAHLPDVATILNNLGVLCVDINAFDDAVENYQKALRIIRSIITEYNQEKYLSDLARTLNNFGRAQKEAGKVLDASKAYVEALNIWGELRGKDPQSHLPDIADLLVNFGDLLESIDEFIEAEEIYLQSLELYRDLLKITPRTCLPEYALALNNYGNILVNLNKYDKAEEAYLEALDVFNKLSDKNPQAYIRDVAMTLSNLGALCTYTKDFGKVEKHYLEALDIRRNLAKNNPQAYLPDVALTLVNLSIFYLQNVPNRDASIRFARECIKISLPFMQILEKPETYSKRAIIVIQSWGLNAHEVIDEICNEIERQSPAQL